MIADLFTFVALRGLPSGLRSSLSLSLSLRTKKCFFRKERENSSTKSQSLHASLKIKFCFDSDTLCLYEYIAFFVEKRFRVEYTKLLGKENNEGNVPLSDGCWMIAALFTVG